MKRRTALLLLFGLVLGAGIFPISQPASLLAQPDLLLPAWQTSAHATPKAKTNADPIHWMSMEDMEKAMKKEKRKVLIVLYTDWCGWCKKLEKETLQNPEIAAYINKYYYAVRFNAEQRKEQIFKDKKYKFVQSGRRGYNELAYELTRGKLSYPTCVFLDENKELIQSIPGYKAPADFQDIITFFGEDYYKKMSWEAFLRM